MNQFTRFILRLLAIVVFSFLIHTSCSAQLTFKGKLWAEGVVRATITEDDGERYDVIISKQKERVHYGDTVMMAKYNFPMGFEPNRDYSIEFTDGTLSKTIIIHGACPVGIGTRTKLKIDIDLVAADADETLVVFLTQYYYWEALPLWDITTINAIANTPFKTN